MDKGDLARQLEFEYHATCAATPGYNETLIEFLKGRKFNDPDDLWWYFPNEAEEAGLPVPDWL